MPELSEYPEAHPEELDELAAGEAATRTAAIDKAWAYYRGEHRKALKVRKNHVDDNVIVNLARKVVNQSVSMLFGGLPTFDLPGDSDEVAAIEEALAGIWERNNAEILLYNLGVSGALAGHVFVKLVAEDSERRVRFVVQNPRYCTAFWRPDDMSAVVCYRIQWAQGKVKYRQDLVADGEVWRVRDLRKEETSDWRLVGESVWPWPFAPLVDWQNLPNPEGYYGEPDLTGAGLNDAVNFVASNINRILSHHAHPKTMGFGLEANQIQETAVDGFWAIPNAEARIENLEMQSDLASSMAYLEFLQAAMFREHQAVDMTSLKDRIGQLTNFGLRVLFKDSLDKSRVKRTLYGGGLCEVSARTLKLLGLSEEMPTAQWPDPLPNNDTEQVGVQVQEIGAGTLSRQTAAEDRGRDWERESERMSEEREAEQGQLADVLLNAQRKFDQGEGE
jgi:hypothetical protein